jgi:hypothetical protein
MAWNDQLRLHVGLRSTGVPEWRSERWLVFADRAGQGRESSARTSTLRALASVAEVAVK